MAKLLVQETAGVREFEIVDAEVHIGRELDNALRLSDPSISRHHAVLRKTSDGYEIHDNQSSNGVLVNGNRIQTLLLKDGDRVTLGQVQITFSDRPVENPLGTVRMTAEDMAKVQTPAQLQTNPLGVPAQPPETPQPPVQQPPAPPVAAPPVVVPPVAASAAPPIAEPHPMPVPAMEEDVLNPAPAFLQAYLPPLPDDARPTGERGDFVTRLVALLIDAVPLVVLGIIVQILAITLASTGMLFLLTCVFPLLQLTLSIGYMVFIGWCWVVFGATPGKKIMKLRVVPEHNLTGRIDAGTAVLRMLGHVINSIPFCLPYLMILGDERKGLQDIMSKSIVIKVDR